MPPADQAGELGGFVRAARIRARCVLSQFPGSARDDARDRRRDSKSAGRADILGTCRLVAWASFGLSL